MQRCTLAAIGSGQAAGLGLRALPCTIAGQQRLLSNGVPTISKNEIARPSVRVKTVGGRSAVSGVVATVFGATGFLGRYVVSLLAEMGSQVICPFRGDGMNARHLKVAGDLGQIFPVPFKPRNLESIERAVERSNVVINLIGQDRATSNFTLDDVHVKIAAQIAEISHKHRVERFLHISALGASADHPSEWLASKARGEVAVRAVFPDATIFRPATMFGHEDEFLNRYGYLASYFPLIPILGGRGHFLQPVDVINVADALVSSLQYRDALGATYELGGPEVYELGPLLDRLFAQAKIESNTVTLPLWMAKLYARALQMLPRSVSALTPDHVSRMLTDSVVVKNKYIKTFADLDIKPTALTDVAPAVLAMYSRAES